MHLPVLLAKQWLPEPIRVVDGLDGSLTASAESSAVNRMSWIAFRLRDASVDRLHDHAASGRALAAGGGVVRANTGRHIIGRNEVRNDVLGSGRAAPIEQGGGTR